MAASRLVKIEATPYAYVVRLSSRSVVYANSIDRAFESVAQPWLTTPLYATV